MKIPGRDAGCQMWNSAVLLVGAVLAACAPAAPTPVAPLAAPVSATVQAPAAPATVLHTAALLTLPSPSPSSSPSPMPTVFASPTPTVVPVQLCAPLDGIALSDMGLPDLLKNPFDAPRPGMDDGHYGADFAYWSRGEHTSMLGLPVYAALSGRVAAVILNRQPYGNAVIIETPLEGLPSAWLGSLQAPTLAPTVQPAASLSCPPDMRSYDHPGRSLYLLYAHFDQTPPVEPGQPVACGQVIGGVGTTGRSVNPHLHLETRVGPSGVTINELAHYDNSTTDDERRSYCTWRVSGLFQAFDPMRLLALQP